MGIMKQIDFQNMRDMIRYFPELLSEIKLEQVLKETIMNYKEQEIEGLCLMGMGGSSIAGSYVKALLYDDLSIPILISRNYTIPKFVNKNWIAIAISYSGNTEETLSSLSIAIKNGLRIIGIASNGEMEKSGYHAVRLPKNLQPRAAFPLIFSTLLSIVELLLFDRMTDLKEITRSLRKYVSDWGKTILAPMEIAGLLRHRIPLFIGSDYLSPVAYRAKCQINENSKHLAFYSEIPEANHNEIEGFGKSDDKLIIPIFIRGSHEHPRIHSRMDITYELYEELKLTPLKLCIKCSSKIEEMLALTHYLDMASIELADIKGVNPITVDRINELKHRLQ